MSNRQSGRGGMGSHKHGTSGRPGPSPRYKLGRTLEANKDIADKAKREENVRKSGMVESVREAFRGRKK